MEAKFYYNSSPNNYINKELEEIGTIYGAFKQPFNIMDPVLQLSKAVDVLIYNYVYIEEVDRYYFVTSQPTFEAGYYNISLHEDILSSFAEDILSHSAIIARQEDIYNAYLHDSKYPILDKQAVTTLAFPRGFSNSEELLLIVNGGA